MTKIKLIGISGRSYVADIIVVSDCCLFPLLLNLVFQLFPRCPRLHRGGRALFIFSSRVTHLNACTALTTALCADLN